MLRALALVISLFLGTVLIPTSASAEFVGVDWLAHAEA